MYVAIKSPIVPEQKLAETPYVDNPFAPEIFATGYSGLANMNGVIVMTLESARCDHSRPQPALERVVVGRVALTTTAALELVTGLNQFLEQQGISPSKMLAAGATFQ
ncbi:hypothetical protein [Sphingomonas sp. PAMC 26617]|uniref:hypothetical protein n=1 Tax=Sphingomonas sp. PAMC 26617 TaxID=1112216 RepID=UPI000287DFB8|nr:hypothetical protein [Sphingomonas sp. PAMC 26617]